MIIQQIKLTYEQLSEQYFLQAEVIKSQVEIIHSQEVIIKSQAEQIALLKELEGKYLIQQHQLEQLRRHVFGSKSERFVPQANPSQTTLELGIEPTATVEVVEQKIAAHTRTKVTKKTNHKGRLPLPSHLPRNVIELTPEESIEGLVCIGTEVKEELDFTPGKLFVNRYERKKYAQADGEGIIVAPAPSHPIPRCMAGTGLLAQILIDKYADHLPLYRQMQRYSREGVDIPKSTFNDWVRDTCSILTLLYKVLQKQVLQSDYLMVDETTIKVLQSEKKGTTHLGYYWVYKSPHDNLVLIDYQKGRGKEGPLNMLRDFKGHLQSDGYGVYDLFENKEGVILLGCMAHARRYFEQALNSDKTRAEYVLQQILLLYQTERKANEQNLTNDERHELRKKESVPVLNALKVWITDNVTQVTPQSPMGKAIAYSLKRWNKLCAYTTDGKLRIDNNPVENAIRPIALGRKNYLFAGSHESAQRAAMIYSFLSICKLNDVNPYTWLKETLDKISDCKQSQLADLLPKSKKTPMKETG